MKKTFKEKAISKTAHISNKYKILTPFAFLILSLVIGVFSVLKYVFENSKKYISIAFIFLFFIISSSFATKGQAMERETYLDIGKDIIIEDTLVALSVGDTNDISDETYDYSLLVISDDLFTEEEERELESTENLDKFTLDDFYSINAIKNSEAISNDKTEKDEWYLLLVNKTHPVPDDYEVKLTTLKGSMKCDERVLEPLGNMLDAANKDNVNIYVCSPYRDFQRQEMLFLRQINRYMSSGKSYLEAYKIASRDVIVPGCSEHQLGIAFDIVSADHAVLDARFGNTEGGKWLKEHCAEYGFILRYPLGKENITGIVYEPWHFRYVGVEAAKVIMGNGITLEEYLEE